MILTGKGKTHHKGTEKSRAYRGFEGTNTDAGIFTTKRGEKPLSYSMSTVRVRYMINDLDPAVSFYTKYLGFEVKQQAKPHFAMLTLGNLELVLSTNYGPGGAAKPMLDGRKAEPGGWNRIILNVADLEAEVARLRQSNVHFRNKIAKGPG